MKRNSFAALIVAASMLGACAGTPADSSDTSKTPDSSETTQDETKNENTSTDSTDASQAPELLDKLVKAAGDDHDAESAWRDLFLALAQEYNMQYTVETDGEDYLYDENGSQTMVKDNFIYDIGKDTVFWKQDDSTLLVDLTDVDDSYDTLEMGYGIIERLGKDPVMSVVNLKDTEDDKLEGTVELANGDDEASDVEEVAINTLIDSAIDFGYVRTANPISNASLYNFDLQKKEGKWVLSASIKDLSAFKEEAKNGAIIVDEYTKRPMLIMDEIESETFTFTFNDKGILESEENNIYHVINGLSDQYQSTYMNLLNKAKFEKAESDDIKPAAFDSYFAGIKDGSIKEGDAFTITDWN